MKACTLSPGFWHKCCLTVGSSTKSLISSSIGRAGNFTETELGEINFPEISAPILEKICEYFYYRLRHMNE